MAFWTGEGWFFMSMYDNYHKTYTRIEKWFSALRTNVDSICMCRHAQFLLSQYFVWRDFKKSHYQLVSIILYQNPKDIFTMHFQILQRHILRFLLTKMCLYIETRQSLNQVDKTAYLQATGKVWTVISVQQWTNQLVKQHSDTNPTDHGFLQRKRQGATWRSKWK
jgi:hypothetical protein